MRLGRCRHLLIDPVVFDVLHQFQAGIYHRFRVQRDALFELLDTVAVVVLVPSLAHLRLAPVQQLTWGSLRPREPVGQLSPR